MWNFTLPDAARADRLRAAPDYAEIVERIISSSTVLCCHEQICCSYPRFSRIVYCIKTDTDLADNLFNSGSGYRGQFFNSIEQGVTANRHLIDALSPTLLSSPQTETCAKSIVNPGESLRTGSAKAWIAEVSMELCPQCTGEWKALTSSPEIENGRWEFASGTRWGCQAPIVTKLRIFGAFIDDAFNEFVPNSKRFRGWDIHKTGWA